MQKYPEGFQEFHKRYGKNSQFSRQPPAPFQSPPPPRRRTLAEATPAPSLQETLDRRDRLRHTVQETAGDQLERVQREVRNLYSQLQRDKEAVRAERVQLAQERQECQEERKQFRLSEWQANAPPPPQLPSAQAPSQGFPHLRAPSLMERMAANQQPYLPFLQQPTTWQQFMQEASGTAPHRVASGLLDGIVANGVVLAGEERPTVTDLLPPADYEMPARSFGVPQGFLDAWATQHPNKLPPRPHSLIPGKPLNQLSAEYTTEDNNRWKTELEDLAASLREFMCDSSRERPWVMPDAPPSNSRPFPGGFSAETIEDNEVFDPVGVPVLNQYEDILRRVAYAEKVEPRNAAAQAVRLPAVDYNRTCAYDVRMTEAEAVVVGFEVGKPKPPLTQLKEKLESDRVVRNTLRTDRDAIGGQADVLKCTLAMGSILDATTQSAQLVVDSIAPSEALLQATLETSNAGSSQAIKCEEALAKARSALPALRSALRYMEALTQVSIDSAARSVRMGVTKCRLDTLRTLCNLPVQEHLSAVETACTKLPVVPSSLFGGRFQMALASLHQGATLHAGVSQAIRDHSQGHLLTQGKAGGNRKRKHNTTKGAGNGTSSSANPSGGNSDFRPQGKKKQKFAAQTQQQQPQQQQQQQSKQKPKPKGKKPRQRQNKRNKGGAKGGQGDKSQ